MLFKKSILLLAACCGPIATGALKTPSSSLRGVERKLVSFLVLETPAYITTIKEGTDATFSKAAKTDIKVIGDLAANHVVSVTATSGTVTLAGTTDITLSAGTGTGDAAVSFSGAADAVNAALDGMKYTPTSGFLGYASLDVEVTDSSTGEKKVSVVDILVNQALDETSTINTILNGVTQIHGGVNPGTMVAYGPTALNVAMFPDARNQGPLVVASSYGQGKIMAVPDHQMLLMQTYSAESGTFYKNAISWLTGTNNDLSVNIVCYSLEIKNWLIAEGYTNVVKTGEGKLISKLQTADVFIANHIGGSEPEANLQAMKDFAAQGGGILMGPWGKTYDSPSSIVFRDVGIGFRSDITAYYPGTIDAIPATFQVTGEDAVAILKDPSGFTADQEDYVKGFLMGGISLVLKGDHPLPRRLGEAMSSQFESIYVTIDNPVTDDATKALLNMERDILMSTLARDVKRHRQADLYGDIPADAERVTRTVKIRTDRNRWQPTGLYAVPGELVTVEVPEVLVGKGLKIRVNAHKDDINRRDEWWRPPMVHRFFEITSTTVEVACGFGGAIFIDFLGDEFSPPTVNAGVVDVTISNAIEHPFFDDSQHTDDDWNNGPGALKNKPAPYAVFVTKDFMFCQRSSDHHLANLTEPTALMNFWQQVVEKQDYVAGYVNDRTSSEFTNVDVQISAGSGHAGYPIQATESIWSNLADWDYLKTEGNWGDYHELGHNHQRPWNKFNTPSETEITVNIFSAYAMREVTPHSENKWAKKCVKEKDTFAGAITAMNQAQYYSSIDTDRVFFYFHLGAAFGYEKMREVLMSYEIDNRDGNPLPQDNTAEKDQWFIRWSMIAGVDMTKYMVDSWGLEVSSDALTEVANMGLPKWLPAMGTVDSASTIMGESVTIDIGSSLLSIDGVAQLLSVMEADDGAVTLASDGVFLYTPKTGMYGTDRFSYTVKSSTGTEKKTDVEVTVNKLQEGQVYVVFPDHPERSGVYHQSKTDTIQGEYVWYEDGVTENTGEHYFLYKCQSDKWVSQSLVWRSGVFGNNGSNCAGIGSSLQGDGSETYPWEYTWNMGTGNPTFELPLDGDDPNVYEFQYDAVV